ncbi:MAG: low molecular weight protein-tyrosine-phosphatase [Burkholderiaceae bacterium]
MVCMGNICRSPTAEAVLRHRAERAGLAQWLHIDSAGPHGYHPGEPPDARSQRHAALRGYDLSGLRARQLVDADYQRFDLLLAMDWDNLALMEAGCPQPHRRKLRRLMEFAPEGSSPVVPDPYLGGPQGFEQVLDLIEHASDGLTKHLEKLIRRKSDPSV